MESKDLDVNFGTFQKDVLSEKIVDKLLTLIREKQLRPGDRLPPERELAIMMGVSRPSLREALRALSIMRVIENRQGSGTFVTSLKPELFVEHLDFIFKVNDATFMDLFQARKILEVGLASLAAPRITFEEIVVLEDCVQRSALNIDDPEAFLKADLEIHQHIINAAQNHILALFMESINQLNVASRRRTGELPEVRRQTLQDHRAILAALKAHDPALAGDAMRHHLDFVEQQLKEMAELESTELHS
jgi:GntR family transcriptional regulator, transcriptional repressor for pyruvate dehydrogenase complex